MPKSPKKKAKKRPTSRGAAKKATSKATRASSKKKVAKKAKTPSKKKAAASKPAGTAKAAAKKAATTKPSQAATPKKKPSKPPKPKKPKVDPELQRAIREALVNQRHQLMSVVQSTRAQMAEKSTGLSDVSDQASEGYGDELAVGLIAIEAAQLEDIEAAIARIDNGTYGLCLDCEKPIPKKRLEVLPFARRCLACEGMREHRARTQGSYADDD